MAQTICETSFGMEELLSLRFWATANSDKALRAKINAMVECLEQCESSKIYCYVSAERATTPNKQPTNSFDGRTAFRPLEAV